MRRCTTIAAGVVRCGTWSSSAVVIGAHCVTSGPVRIGIGLPNTVPGGGDVLTPWARLADPGGGGTPGPGGRSVRRVVRADGAVRGRLRARRRTPTCLRLRRGKGVCRVGGLRATRPSAAVGTVILRAGRRGGADGGRAIPAGLLRVHRSVRREDRRDEPDVGASDP